MFINKQGFISKSGLVLRLGLVLLFSSSLVHADEDDWEFGFGIEQKSTIADFPLQEIGQAELSDAVIGGALQSTSSGNYGSGEAKPAYEEQEEEYAKEKEGRLDLEEDPVKIEDLIRFGQVTPIEPTANIRPYQTDQIRVMDNNFTTLERP